MSNFKWRTSWSPDRNWPSVDFMSKNVLLDKFEGKLNQLNQVFDFKKLTHQQVARHRVTGNSFITLDTCNAFSTLTRLQRDSSYQLLHFSAWKNGSQEQWLWHNSVLNIVLCPKWWQKRKLQKFLVEYHDVLPNVAVMWVLTQYSISN